MKFVIFLTFISLLSAEPAFITNKTTQETRILTFDWDQFQIGFAEFPAGPTGCTVFSFPKRKVNAVVDIRGGAPGSVFTDLLREGMDELDVIVFTGGSTLGLGAATGITEEIFKDRHDLEGWDQMPYVAGSVIFDWVGRKEPLYPTPDLGIAAYRSAETGKFHLGRYGVGSNATIAKLFGLEYRRFGGQGGAVESFGDIKIAVFTVTNALGAIYDSQGKMLYGYLNPKTHKPISEKELFAQVYPFKKGQASPEKKGNTTLTLVIVNVDLEFSDMRSLSHQVHNSLADIIRPFGTSLDGDTLYLVSTRELKIPEKEEDIFVVPRLGVLATKVAKKAIYSVFE